MSDDMTLDKLAQMIAGGFKEASEDRAEIRETLDKHSKTLAEHTKLLQQPVKFDQVEDRLLVIETQLGIDSRQTAGQSS